MAWRDRLMRGAWRMIPFHLEEHTLSGGRRVAVHEFPGRDDSLCEDLGRKPRRFAMRWLVAGSDYFSWRDEMRAALEQAGPGDLRHPYLGEICCCVEDFSLRESKEEGGVCWFDVTLVEATSRLRQVTEVDHAGAVRTATEAVKVEVAAATMAEVAVVKRTVSSSTDESGVPIIVEQHTPRSELGIAASLSALSGSLAQMRGQISALQDRAAAIGAAASGLMGQAAALSKTPTAMVSAVIGVVDALLSAMVDGAQLATLGALAAKVGADWDDPLQGRPAVASAWAPKAASADRAAQARTQAAIIRLVKASFAAAMADAAADAEFATVDEASAVSSAICALVDDVLAHLPEDASQEAARQALVALRVASCRQLDSAVADLPRLQAHTPIGTICALVLAQQLYGDAARAQEIIAINRLPSPLFVQGGVPIQVLSDD